MDIDNAFALFTASAFVIGLAAVVWILILASVGAV